MECYDGLNKNQLKVELESVTEEIHGIDDLIAEAQYQRHVFEEHRFEIIRRLGAVCVVDEFHVVEPAHGN